MDGNRFDDLTKQLAAAPSRRQFLKTLAGGAAGGVLALLGLGDAAAQTRCQPQAKECRRNVPCCTGLVCVPEQGGSGTRCCPPGTVFNRVTRRCEQVGCTGGTCDTVIEQCNPNNPNCFCFTKAEGGGVCGCDFFCDEAQPCASSAECPDGSVCLVNTCCGEQGFCTSICEPDDTCTLGGGGGTLLGGPTAAGR